MSEWKKVKLGDVCDKIGSGATPSGGSRAYCDSGIALVRSQNVIDFQFSKNGLAYINDEQATKLNGVTVRSGDVLLNITGDSVARVCKVPDAILPARVNQHVCILRPNPLLLSSTYLQAVLFSVKRELLTMASAGATRNALTKGDLADFEIPLPPLATQRKIAAVLGALDDKIENNRKICANLEAQAQALFKSWFVDFEPFGGKMPSGWKMGKVEDLASSIASGGTPKTKVESYWNGCVRWYSTKELKDGFLFDSEKHISSGAVENSAAKIFPRNTILMAIYAAPTVGRLGILDGDSTFNQAAVGIVPKRGVGYPFIFSLLKNERDGLNLMAVGSCQQNLNVGVVRSYRVVIPDERTLSNFNSTVLDLFEDIRMLSKQSRALAATRDALLPKLMSGEIDVEKVEV